MTTLRRVGAWRRCPAGLSLRLVIGFAALGFTTLAPSAPSHAAANRNAPRQVRIGKWEIAISHSADGESGTTDTLRIARRDQPESAAWTLSDQTIYLGPREPGPRTVPAGTDMNGNGIPDLVVSSYSGGSMCCSSIYVLELSDTVRVLAHWQMEKGAVVAVHGLDRDGKAELVVAESLDAADTPCSHAATPGGRVVLSWRDGRFCPVPELMRAAPDPKWWRLLPAVQESTAEPGGSQVGWAPCEAWQAVVGYIYTGNAAMAARFVSAAWPWYDLSGVVFLLELRELLQRRLMTECQRPTLAIED